MANSTNSTLSMASIYKLKQTEYRTGALLAYENFESLLEISKKAAHIENFGAASSLCVLAMEELTKSVILQIKSINNLIPVKDLDKYFTSHETKHNAGLDLYIKIESNYKDDNDEFNSNDDSKTSLVIAIAVIALLLIWSYSKNVTKKDKKKEKSYFDSIKESGFYVGYDESLRQWKSPKSEHTKKSFDDLLKITNDFVEKVRNWIFNGKLNEENIIDFLNCLSDEIIDKEKLKNLNKNY